MVVLRKPQAFGWLRTLSVAGLLTALAASSGCQTATGTGAAAGGALGTGIGLLASRGCPGGALIGGLIGAGAGALGGAAVDEHRERKVERAVAADVAMRAPTLEQIVELTQKAIPPSQIIEQIRTSGAVYRLTPENLAWLNQQGVNGAVIREIQDTAYRGPRRVYAPVVVEQPVYVGPPVAVGVGWGGRGWR
jgi:osmotically inducible lipoprotein OsmB